MVSVIFPIFYLRVSGLPKLTHNALRYFEFQRGPHATSMMEALNQNGVAVEDKVNCECKSIDITAIM